jgi:hypothetical protein
MEPTVSFLGAWAPFASFAAFLIRNDAGGVFVTKVKVLSENIVIRAGMIVPSWLFVLSLKALQNSMMFTPCWPSAGPTGGEGVA